jgi:hypothetical protein
LGMPASTVHRILVRRGLNRLAWMDRPTGRVIRRYERERPAAAIGGTRPRRRQEAGPHPVRMLGRQVGDWQRSQVGYEYLHAAVDDHSRLAYVEIAADEGDQRQGGALQPHPARRVGLRPPLQKQRGPRFSLADPPAPVQPSPRPHRTRSPGAHLTRQQRPGPSQLAAHGAGARPALELEPVGVLGDRLGERFS